MGQAVRQAFAGCKFSVHAVRIVRSAQEASKCQPWRALGLSAGAVIGLRLSTLCFQQSVLCSSIGEASKQASSDDGDDEDDDAFEFRFARPPVVSADFCLATSVNVTGGALSGKRPVAEISTTSTFSLPVERGWPRDTNTPAEVATLMTAIIADRFPRWIAAEYGLALEGAPPQLRGFQGWPLAGADDAVASLMFSWWPQFLPPVLSLQRLEEDQSSLRIAFMLGGMLCANLPVVLEFHCEPVGISTWVGSEEGRSALTCALRRTFLDYHCSDEPGYLEDDGGGSVCGYLS